MTSEFKSKSIKTINNAILENNRNATLRLSWLGSDCYINNSFFDTFYQQLQDKFWNEKGVWLSFEGYSVGSHVIIDYAYDRNQS